MARSGEGKRRNERLREEERPHGKLSPVIVGSFGKSGIHETIVIEFADGDGFGVHRGSDTIWERFLRARVGNEAIKNASARDKVARNVENWRKLL